MLPDSITTLASLGVGQLAYVTGLRGENVGLLRAMGLREGVQVCVRRTGHRCLIEAGRSRVGLTRELTASIDVTPVD